MTTQAEVRNDKNYIAVLDHGFVGLVDSMGDDSSIVRAARVSYGKGTKKISEDRGLIRYLFRHSHTTPVEMVEFKFHCKMPIFTARQWIRHRTANVNEYSARYSILTNEFYIPKHQQMCEQSSSNNQGRKNEPISKEYYDELVVKMQKHHKASYDLYEFMLNDSGEVDENKLPIPTDPNRPMLTRELSRMELPTSGYTEWYWKIDLHNLLHFLSLRMDKHAQWEIRQFAEEMYKFIQPIVPLTCEAFEDYNFRREAIHFSKAEWEIARKLINLGLPVIPTPEIDSWMKDVGMSKREITEFLNKIQ